MTIEVRTGGLMKFRYKNQKTSSLSKEEKDEIDKSFQIGRKRQEEERIAEEERKRRWKRRNSWHKIRSYLIAAIVALIVLFILRRFLL